MWLSQIVQSILKAVAPTASDSSYPIGWLWIDQVLDRAYLLVDVTAGSATWLEIGAGGGFVIVQGTVTLVGGIATVTGPGLWTIETEAAAATDELDKIVGLNEGEIVLLQPANNARVTMVTPGAFMDLAFDFPLDNVAAKYALISAGSDVCEELYRASNT